MIYKIGPFILLPPKIIEEPFNVKEYEENISCKEILENFGFKFFNFYFRGIFQLAKLPPGWRTKEDLCWVCLIDKKNRRRGRIFYRGENSIMYIERRFDIRVYVNLDSLNIVVLDNGNKTVPQIIYVKSCSNDRNWIYTYKKVQEWLEEKYPDWRSAAAYWDGC